MSIVIGILLLFSAFAHATEGQKYKGRSLESVLQELQDQGWKIIYSSELIRPDMMVKREPVSEVRQEFLNQLLRPHGLKVDAGPDNSFLIVLGPAQATGIRGLVLDRRDQQPLVSVRVELPAHKRTVWTDESGIFSISDLEEGTYELSVSLPGYHGDTKSGVVVKSGRMTEIRIDLEPERISLGEIVVTPSHFAILNDDPDSRFFLDRKDIQATPHLFDDLNRAISRLPGAARGDFTARLNVRGGESDEVLVVLDGLEVYEPFHLRDFLSLFSIVDSEAVGEVQFMTGAFPIEFGNRMSGVLEMTSIDPGPSMRTLVGLSFINARFQNEGTFDEQRGQWLFSVRRGYLDLVLPLVDPESGFDPTYYDVLGKIQYRINDRHILAGQMLGAFDDVRFHNNSDTETVNAHYNNVNLWFNWKTFWNSNLYSQTIFFRSALDSRRAGGVNDFPQSTIRVNDNRSSDVLGVKQDWVLDLSRHYLKWGIDLKRLDSSYDYSGTSSFDSTTRPDPSLIRLTETNVQLEPSGYATEIYASDRFELLPSLTAELGLRWDRQTYSSDSLVSPRLNLIYRLSNTTFRAGWGRFVQPQRISELQVEDGINHFWPAQKGSHSLVSVEHALGRQTKIRVEWYRKHISNPRPRFENLFDPVELFPEAEPDRIRIDPSRARASGVEFLVQQRLNERFQWWAGYTLATAEDRENEDWIPRSWDQRHQFSFSATFRPNSRWSLNLAGVFHSGWPTTELGVKAVEGTNGETELIPVLGPRNAIRYPHYARLDARASRTAETKNGRFTFFVEVINLLNRKNPGRTTDFRILPQPDGSYLVIPEYENWLPFLPSFGISWEF